MNLRQLLTWLLIGAIGLGNSSCSVNVLETFANKNTNGAFYEDALKKIRTGDFDGALVDIGKMNGAYASTNAVTELKASAYAGRCGLDFLGFVKAFTDMGSTRLFPFLLGTFKGASSSKIDDCVTAQTLITSIGSVAARSNDDNLFLVLVEFAKMGKILTYYADLAQSGTVTAVYDPCAVGAAPRPAAGGAISDADAAQFGASLSLVIENLTALAGQVNLGSGSLSNISDICTQLSSAGAAYNFCAVTDPTAFTPQMILAVRSLILEGSVLGLRAGSCSAPYDVQQATCRCF